MRGAGLGDLDELAEIHARSSQRAYARIFPPDAPIPSFDDIAARWRPALEGGGTSMAFVAEIDGATVGGAIADSESARGYGNLRHLYVDPDAWGLGAGRLLHEAVVTWCRLVGCDDLELWVLERNDRARRMYERWGWSLDPGERLVHAGLDVAEVRYLLARVPGS